ncbi:MAG: hypothetical protein SGJ21_04435 [Alphaproteobacteria bacterium]|nr:hypothetical protein [Alphaproteobacteria bacterium]
MSQRSYPDISDILARKAEGRREQARASFAEKLAVLDRLRTLADSAKQARLSRSGQLSAHTGKPKSQGD